jgi:acetyl esterase/lipase
MNKAGIFFFLLLLSISCNEKSKGPAYYVPTTISKEAQQVVMAFPFKDTVDDYPAPDEVDRWKKYQERNEEIWTPFNDTIKIVFEPVLRDTLLDGVPVLEVKPKNYRDNGKVLVYLHGGAYTLFSAHTMLGGAVPVADVTGLKVISVNYTNPPQLKYNDILNQVIAVIKALLSMGYDMNDIGIYGDSAGGGLAAGSVLKMRDDGLGMPAVVVLISPWSDITSNGDTYRTLMGQDPVIEYNNSLRPSSLAYAPASEHKNPYVSPVYGDYTKGFPPTLIQGGTKEIFLSNFVRHYQALDMAGVTVKLDLYEGMWHVFQEINYDLPESKIAQGKFRDWVYKYLLID